MREGPILVINLGWEQARLIDLLAKTGRPLYGVHSDEVGKDCVEFREVIVADPRDLPKILAFAERIKPTAVISDQCDYSLFSSAVVAERFGLPGVSLGAAQRGTNKFLMREAIKAAGLPQPDFRLCSDMESATRAAADLGYPVIVKPIDNRGSFGVNRVDAKSGLAGAVSDAVMNSASRLFLVERYIDGEQIIVEGYASPNGSHRSLAIGWKTLSAVGTRQIADTISFPCDLSDARSQQIIAHNDQVARALGFARGATSGEYRIDAKGQLQLLEMANRGGGVLISSHIVPAVSGFDVTAALVRDALGNSHDSETKQQPRECVQMHYLRYPEGSVEAVEGLSAAGFSEGVMAMRWYGLAAGGVIRAPNNDAERQGMLIARGATVEQAANRARTAAAHIQIRYAP